MGFSGLKLALVAAVICTSASRQISSIRSRRSASVRKPMLYCCWTSATICSCSLRISALRFSGITMSFFETVTAARVA